MELSVQNVQQKMQQEMQQEMQLIENCRIEGEKNILQFVEKK